MKTLFLLFIGLVVAQTIVRSQTDTTSNNLLSDITSQNDTISLLPQKMIPTQRLLWGEKGLMRHSDRFELTPEKRQNELKLRRIMLSAHQVSSFLTLGSMIAQGVIGFQVDNGNTGLHKTHETLAIGVNTLYVTSATLALFSPPKMMNERAGYSSIKVHKNLAIIHMLGMIATNVLANQMKSDPSLRQYHKAAAITTFVALEASMFIIKF